MAKQTTGDQLRYEADVLKGKATRHKTFASERTFPDEQATQQAFERAIQKLKNVNAWSDISWLSASFQLFDSQVHPKAGYPPRLGDFMLVQLPGPTPENWVKVTAVFEAEHKVGFTVQPCRNPNEEPSAEIDHFFQPEARSTFVVEQKGLILMAAQIGEEEGINNHQPEAGNRTLINTLIAEVGWWFYQAFQWKRFTDYLLNDEEA